MTTISKLLRPGHLSLALILSIAAVNVSAEANSRALATIEGYMASLFVGDTEGMSGKLGEQMLSERGAVLGNPGYGRTLQQAYSGATYKVVDSTQTSDTAAEITVRIKLASSDKLHVKFALQQEDGSYRIVSEQ